MHQPLKAIRPLELEAIIHLARKRSDKVVDDPSKPITLDPFTWKNDPIDDAVCLLSPEALSELTAVMWIGRGFSGEQASEWAAVLESAKGMHVTRPDFGYVSGKLQLHDHVEEGLKKLGYERTVIHF